MPQIQYSEKYYDDIYEYRCVGAPLRRRPLLYFFLAPGSKSKNNKEIRLYFLGGPFDVRLPLKGGFRFPLVVSLSAATS